VIDVVYLSVLPSSFCNIIPFAKGTEKQLGDFHVNRFLKLFKD
jgi:hypothetical protein